LYKIFLDYFVKNGYFGPRLQFEKFYYFIVSVYIRHLKQAKQKAKYLVI